MTLYVTKTRQALLQGVADLEISLDDDGTYRWLGNRKVNAGLEELESQGWIAMGPGQAPHITGLGRIRLREAKAQNA